MRKWVQRGHVTDLIAFAADWEPDPVPYNPKEREEGEPDSPTFQLPSSPSLPFFLFLLLFLQRLKVITLASTLWCLICAQVPC